MHTSAAVVLLSIVLALAVVVFAAASETQPRGLVGLRECCRQLDHHAEARGALKGGMEQALTLFAQGRNVEAQKVAEAALAQAGYICEWKSNTAVQTKETSSHFECRLVQ